MKPQRAVRAAALLVLWCLAAASRAAAAGGCAGFEWPLDVELGWMNASEIETLHSGAKLTSLPQKAFTLVLARSESFALPTPPSGKPHDAANVTYAGLVTLAEISASGLYQVSISGPGWIDVVQNGAAVATQAETSSVDCPVIRESLRFQLAKGPAILELSSVPAAKIRFTIRRAK